jgi:hypothetical protein
MTTKEKQVEEWIHNQAEHYFKLWTDFQNVENDKALPSGRIWEFTRLELAIKEFNKRSFGGYTTTNRVL